MKQIRFAMSEDQLPDVASLDYPPRRGWHTELSATAPAVARAFYSTFDFWKSTATPEGPEPFQVPDKHLEAGVGSVKAAVVIDHGLCSHLVPYADMQNPNNPSDPSDIRDGIFPQISTGFFSALITKLASGRAKDDPEDATRELNIQVNASDVASFLRTSTDRDNSMQGGFFFNFDLSLVNIADIPIVGDVSARAFFNHAFAFRLLDGRLTVDPIDSHSEAGGFVDVGQASIGPLVADSVRTQLNDALLTAPTGGSRRIDTGTLAGTLWTIADRTEEFPGLLDTPCDQRAPGDETILVSTDPTISGSECAPLFSQMKNALKISLDPGHMGSAVIGVPPNAFTQLWDDTALAPDPNNAKVFKNFRCAPRRSRLTHEVQNLCRYVTPARRINVLPDGVELVFVDDDKEYNNPSFIPWLILLDVDAPGKTFKDGLGQLCDAPRARNPRPANTFDLARRSFVDFPFDNKNFSVFGPCIPSGSGFDCGPVIIQ